MSRGTCLCALLPGLADLATTLRKPLLLDLFCGQGGACVGYQVAGWSVIGVDLVDYARYYRGRFVQGDALAILAASIACGCIGYFAAVHTSPPCQGYSIATAGNPAARAKHVRLIAATRDLLEQTGLPWVIENVEQARSEMSPASVLLCGRHFGHAATDVDGCALVLDRHRLFETNWDLPAPDHPPHDPAVQVAGVYGGSRRAKVPKGTPLEVAAPLDRHEARYVRKGGYVPRSKLVQQTLLGIDWMTLEGMKLSIPPTYSTYVGAHLLDHLEGAAAL